MNCDWLVILLARYVPPRTWYSRSAAKAEVSVSMAAADEEFSRAAKASLLGARRVTLDKPFNNVESPVLARRP